MSIKTVPKIAVLGASAGGFQALRTLVEHFDHPLPIPILMVIHRLKKYPSLIEDVFSDVKPVKVKEAEQDEKLEVNTLYINPADYHMVILPNHTVDLSHSKPINFSRPSIDVTMNSVAKLYRKKAIGIILTGANIDGSVGLKSIHDHGGDCFIQDPEEAMYPHMPQAAQRLVPEARIRKLHEIALYLQNLPQN